VSSVPTKEVRRQGLPEAEGLTDFDYCVRQEIASARREFAPIHSVHEGLAVIREEYLELEREVFRRDIARDAIYAELVQMAAMCRRCAEDLGL